MTVFFYGENRDRKPKQVHIGKKTFGSASSLAAAEAKAEAYGQPAAGEWYYVEEHASDEPVRAWKMTTLGQWERAEDDVT